MKQERGEQQDPERQKQSLNGLAKAAPELSTLIERRWLNGFKPEKKPKGIKPADFTPAREKVIGYAEIGKESIYVSKTTMVAGDNGSGPLVMHQAVEFQTGQTEPPKLICRLNVYNGGEPMEPLIKEGDEAVDYARQIFEAPPKYKTVVRV